MTKLTDVTGWSKDRLFAFLDMEISMVDCTNCDGTGIEIQGVGTHTNDPATDYDETTCNRCGGDGVLPANEA